MLIFKSIMSFNDPKKILENIYLNLWSVKKNMNYIGLNYK